ncbi:hypothetical protein Pla175_22970 [Pirellulimonas nuda]|uniref:Uncharacterized protein n=1 Tax=Pirellulimonas nuda TaxID=2528009 RepID=A0A518DBS1_9BACT|nr:hypothetical protein [Pirellulimonas nuda]QDU88913.1 hypothetical protein Pla175_22970 [Pirellulimonas nuda]
MPRLLVPSTKGVALVLYHADVERRMVNFYGSLSEKDRRRYAAVEAKKLGRGGMAYISALFGCDRGTIRSAEEEVERLPKDEAAGGAENGDHSTTTG